MLNKWAFSLDLNTERVSQLASEATALWRSTNVLLLLLLWQQEAESSKLQAARKHIISHENYRITISFMHTSSLKHANNLTAEWHGNVGQQTTQHLHRPWQRVIARLQEYVRNVRDEEQDATSCRSRISYTSTSHNTWVNNNKAGTILNASTTSSADPTAVKGRHMLRNLVPGTCTTKLVPNRAAFYQFPVSDSWACGTPINL